MDAMDWPFAQPFGWYRDVAAESELGSDEWYAAINVLRFAAGLPAAGHKLTYDFWLGHTSAMRYRSRWERL